MQKMSLLVRAIRVRKLVLAVSLPHVAKISSQQPEVWYPTSCALCSRCEGPSHRLPHLSPQTTVSSIAQSQTLSLLSSFARYLLTGARKAANTICALIGKTDCSLRLLGGLPGIMYLKYLA